ncbi:rhamnulokinase [Nocardia tenerifensis]|uniref:Rhamnulokinase n=1 Tax=Nocardia tenerifensis TaxID=228006 RepID=A0A318KBB1_9NOCA|nr:rhamnulokinase family protein [Nocardia tenerifensis]PXX71811.1 rhamnulokinase [Nocardia tenerifensis]
MNGSRAGEVAAVDLGATSGRVIVGSIAPGRLELREVARFPNEPVEIWNGRKTSLHWNIARLYAQVRSGLMAAVRQAPELLGVGIDSWAVDYGLLRGGRLLGLPHHYRDSRTAAGVAAVHDAISPWELYARNGLQFLPFTTIYQLAAERLEGDIEAADRALLIPDLIAYWLSGVMATERTNASTTGLLGRGGHWDADLHARTGVRRGLFPDLVDPGTILGPSLSAVGLDHPVQVSAVASHDTASAVAAIPMCAESAAYISCGTWGLVGVELTEPVIDAAGWAANFTNEIGADGRIRFLHNVMGLWLLSETVRRWQDNGQHISLERLLRQAASYPAPPTVFDVDDPRFLPPGDMPARIAEWYTERDLPAPANHGEMVRAIVESIAVAFAANVHAAATLSGVRAETVHIVGGGARNQLLCQLTADHVGLPVVAGPVEATAIGNILIQARTHRLLSGDLEALRAEVAGAFTLHRYTPTTRAGR